MNAFSLLLLSLAAADATIDDFSYADASIAAAAWTAPSDTPKLQVATDNGRPYVKLSAPFATDPDILRVFIDRSTALDLRSAGEFTLEVAADVPEAIGQISLYFHSGGGWYAASGHLTQQDWHVLRFAKTQFHVEDEPAGWGEVDRIRIAAWRGRSKDTQLKLRRLAASSHDIAIIVPNASQSGDREFNSALKSARLVGDLLAEAGLGSDAIDESSLVAGALGKRPVVVLAYNPRLSNQSVAVLEQYVERGGKLFVCYNLPPRLATALGFSRGRYVAQKTDGQFSEIRFQTTQIKGMPDVVKQDSWNITQVEPAKPNLHHAMVAGAWYDDQGRPTGHAGLLLSDRGAFFSHIVMGDDCQAKQQMLAAVLGRLCPKLWQPMAEAALDRVGTVGHCADSRQWKAHVAAQAGAGLDRALAAVKTLEDRARVQLAAGNHAEAVATARHAQHECTETYLRTHPSPSREARAVWNHSGTGAFPGDWERSCKLLADNGLNMVLPNMLWGGVAHYPSKVLPRSSVYEEYGDQIAQCTAAAHRHGIEVHVWKVNWNLGRAPKEFREMLRRQGRLQRDDDGHDIDWLCPSHPENLKLELESMLEVARNYDVDGLHFDYIRYPGGHACYCDGCRQRFEADSGRPVKDWPRDCYSGSRKDEYREWRCQQITRLVAAVHREAKRLKPDIKISAAVFGAYPDSRRSVGQDWVAWVQAGYLDFLCPMDYNTHDARFSQLVEDQLRLVDGRVPVYPGIGSWRLSPDRTVGQIHLARGLGAPGFTLFNFTTDLARSTLPALGKGVGSQRAAPPHSSPKP